ncbi:MAG: CocE/NonD family hydrolase, partial [Chloroflexi bacterium]|nr:CocE/NonD family hydrolase [Chloroflexota bacterium]
MARIILSFLWTLIIAGMTACGSEPSNPTRDTVMVPMRDGTGLATDLYFPGSGSPPYPLVLIRTPYNKEWMPGYGQYYAQAGFAVALQDVRGRWASEGEWVPFVHEAEDGYDAIEWLASQEWCTGKVGMVGGSYSGTAQFAAAILKPPHLVTIVPNVAAAMPDANIPRDGGVLALGWALRWADIIETARTGHDLQAKVQHSIQADWTGPLSGLPVIDLDRTIVGREVSYFRDWVTHEPGDDYWDSVEFLEGLEQVDIPVFLQSGWFDPGTRGTRLAFEHLIRGGNRHVRMILGPWAHGDRGRRDLNGIDMGAEAERDLMSEYRKWLEFFLMTDAHDVADEPGVELYVMGRNRWISGPEYPPAAVQIRPLFLAGAPGSEAPGKLAWHRPTLADAADVFTYDPSKPTPSFHAAIKRGALDEYRARVDAGNDVLIYESSPVDEPFDVVGPIKMKLHASSSAKDTDFTVTLYGLTPKGEARVLGLTFGILRARYRDSLTRPSLMDPGTVYPFT